MVRIAEYRSNSRSPISKALVYTSLISSCKPIMVGDNNMLHNPRDLEFCFDGICEPWWIWDFFFQNGRIGNFVVLELRELSKMLVFANFGGMWIFFHKMIRFEIFQTISQYTFKHSDRSSLSRKHC